MANQAENSLPSPNFIRIILYEDFTRLKLSPEFLKRYGNSLSKRACLKVVGSELTWKMEMKRRQGRVWLCKGWKRFAEYYSIKLGYMLMFEYEGESKFSVSIFGLNTMEEIQYPVDANKGNLDNSKSGEMEDEEIDDDDDDDDEEETPTRERMSSSKQSSKQVSQQISNARLKIPNPCFRIEIKHSHIKLERPILYIPQAHANAYLNGQANSGIYLHCREDDDEADSGLFVKYHIEGPPKYRRRLSRSEWRAFLTRNRLEFGDVCVFELVDGEKMVYQVAITRAMDCA